MRKRVHGRAARWAVLAVGAGLLSAATYGAGADDKTSMYKPVLPDDVFARLVTEDAQFVKDGIAKASDKKMAIKAKDAAVMIAVYAQGRCRSRARTWRRWPACATRR